MKTFSLLYFVLISFGCIAQENLPIFSSVIENTVASQNEPFSITYTFVYDHQPQNPIRDFEPTEWVKNNTVNQSSGQRSSYLNGKITCTHYFTYSVVFSDTGRVKIPASCYLINDQKLCCKAAIIQVVKKEVNRISNTDKIFVKLEFPKEPIYVGNQVLIDLVFYTQVRLDHMNLITPVSIDGIALEENKKAAYIERATGGKVVNLEGKEYKRMLGGQYVYNPLHAGTFELDQLEISIKKGNDFFEKKEQETLYSEKGKTIEVQSFDAFSKRNLAKNGDSLNVILDDSRLEQGRLILDVELWGKGNSIFYAPLSLGLAEEEALVKTELLEGGFQQKGTELLTYKKYRYVVDFKKRATYKLALEWTTWHNKERDWKRIIAPPHQLEIRNVAPKTSDQIDLSNIDLKTESDADMVFVVDVSTSMLAKDFEPNRLGAVQQVLGRLIDQKLPTQRAAVLIFSGDAMLLCPLTDQKEVLKNSLEQIKINLLPNGTAISTGLMLGIEQLKNSSAKQKNIVIFTDGVQNMGYIHPNMVAEIACQLNISIQAIGVGTNGMAKTPVYRNISGEYIYELAPVKIDEALLSKISEQTCGAYARIAEEDDLKKDLEHLLTKNKNSTSGLVLPTPMIDILLQEVRLKSEKATRKVDEEQVAKKMGTKKEE